MVLDGRKDAHFEILGAFFELLSIKVYAIVDYIFAEERTIKKNMFI